MEKTIALLDAEISKLNYSIEYHQKQKLELAQKKDELESERAKILELYNQDQQ